tara:strand:+ start:471 stop:812 length:342 start_codon:yes stop_codon:yes gene_type:complete
MTSQAATTSTTNALGIFNSNKIYEFAIRSPHGTFYDYCRVVFDPTNSNFKIYSYYSLDGKMKPCKTTREGDYDVIELKKVVGGRVIFKGPRFTEGPRKGQYDPWELTKRIFNM